MDRLISLEPSNLVAIRIEPGQKCYGELTLRNVMYTMPVAFRIQALNKARYTVKPQSGIISPLATLTVEITYQFLPASSSSILPETFPYCEDAFLLHSVVVPGASIKETTSNFDAVPQDWFTAKKKQVFIDSGIKIMFVGSPILAQLVKEGSMDQIREVLERSDLSWNPPDSMDSNGRTLLHIAISQSRPDIVQLLLEFEPDIELQGRSRTGGSGSTSTPLEEAAGAGEDLIVELLLARRASLERSETSKLGPIHLAAMKGHIEVLRLLILKGANVDSLTKDGDTALHLAVEERRRDCARLLLANGAKPDIRNVNGDTPLHRAAKEGDESMVKLLLQKFANKYIRNKNSKTAYDVAVEYGRTNLFDMLKLGDSLCTAARKGEVQNIIKLINNGAVINGKDQHGWTALHRAAFKGKIEAVRALIDREIDINGKDEDGYTALHCAVESGHCDVIELLVKKGADVEARTNKGITALQIAESLHYAGIIRVLLHSGAVKDGGLPAPANLPIGKNVVKQVEIKKRPPRSRALRSSFDRTMALTVL